MLVFLATALAASTIAPFGYPILPDPTPSPAPETHYAVRAFKTAAAARAWCPGKTDSVIWFNPKTSRVVRAGDPAYGKARPGVFACLAP